MTATQDVETSVTTNNGSSQDYIHQPDDQLTTKYDKSMDQNASTIFYALRLTNNSFRSHSKKFNFIYFVSNIGYCWK